MTNSQAELEHINRQRKQHSTLSYAANEAMTMLFTQIPKLIECKAGVVRDDIYRADPQRKDAMTLVKLSRNDESIRTLEAVYTAICEHRKAVGEVDTNQD